MAMRCSCRINSPFDSWIDLIHAFDSITKVLIAATSFDYL